MNYVFEVNSIDRKAVNGSSITIVDLTANLEFPTGKKVPYAMTVKYSDGIVMHDVNKLQRDIADSQIRRDLISKLKQFIKTTVM